MATRQWIVNASPLILLGKVGRLNLLVALADELIVPRAVLREVQARKNETAITEHLKQEQRFHIAEDTAVPPLLLAWDLGAGETQVIALALKSNRKRVVLDDLEARRCARAMDLPLIGTLGVVTRAKRLGIIERARPVIQQLRQVGLYMTDELVEGMLSEVGE